MAQTLSLLLFAVLNFLSCNSEVRARDPDVEEEEAVELGGWTQQVPDTFGTAHFPIPHEHRHQGTPISMPPAGTGQNSGPLSRETVQPPAQRGNWCAFMNHRVVTFAELCGTEMQTIKSVNPCHDGTPDCQVTMYRLSSRPVYRQKHRALSSVQWKCCSGYGGPNCQEKVKLPEDETHKKSTQSNSESSHSGVSDMDDSEEIPIRPLAHRVSFNRKGRVSWHSGWLEIQSRGKMMTDLLEDAGWDDKQEPPVRSLPLPVPPHQSPAGAKEGIPTSQPLPFLDSSILLSMHQLMSTMMSQLQPVLEKFNQTLERLSSEVDELSQDMQQLRLEQEENRSSRGEGHSGAFEERLMHSHHQISQMKTQLDTQRVQMERALQSQQELLQQNLTNLKEEMDHQIRQSQDTQVNLQSLSEMVEEVKLGQKRLEGALQKERAESVKQSSVQPAQESRVWDAITRLHETAQSNSAQLSSLSKNSDDTARVVQDVRRDLLNLEQKLAEVKQRSEVHFAETGLEVEATRVKVLSSISELAANLSAHEGQLREIELDMENINQLQSNDSPTVDQACNCKLIGNSLVKLELEVANVTKLARETRLALDEADLDRNHGPWASKMEDLHQGLLNMKESLAFEQSRSRTLNDNVSQLKASVLDSQEEIRDLRERDETKTAKIRTLFATFSSLLNDAVRHSEVLEVLLGEEVMEFISWSPSQQKELSIPNLLQKMHSMQQKIESHDSSLASLRKKHPEEHEMNSDDPVSYSEWTGTKNQVRGTEASLADPATEEDNADYSVSDFWSLGKEVEQLASRINLLEEHCGNCTAPSGGSVLELQANVASLRQSLEDHLRSFQKLFSRTEELESSGRSINLDEVWRLVRRREGKKRRRYQNQNVEMEEGGISSSWRTKRYSEPDHGLLPQSPVVFVTRLDHRTGPNSELTLRNVDMNHGDAFSPTSGVFQAPETGVYLFLVTLDFERGHSLAILKRCGIPVASLRQEQGERGGPVSRACLLELRRGETVTLQMIHGSLRRAQPGDNTLSGLLLFITDNKDIL